ncbi:hypothetical protein KQX54_004203 [Cotesia glomerata]|uniref:Uncharacterized protein n=1 Tax=Cotesia glomerata TaxID=32391 RepID=A0AAV7J274_COTGL|nr:hypothetical protein KQX54_004203 [Cotesia glomerata]
MSQDGERTSKTTKPAALEVPVMVVGLLQPEILQVEQLHLQVMGPMHKLYDSMQEDLGLNFDKVKLFL